MPLVPALGAGTFGALAALHVGWNLNFLFLLDGDHQGDVERNRYSSEFGIPRQRIATLNELFSGAVFIEDLLDVEALNFIQTALKLEQHPSKSQIRRFFQERLASDALDKISPAFVSRAKALLVALKAQLDLN